MLVCGFVYTAFNSTSLFAARGPDTLFGDHTKVTPRVAIPSLLSQVQQAQRVLGSNLEPNTGPSEPRGEILAFTQVGQNIWRLEQVASFISLFVQPFTTFPRFDWVGSAKSRRL